jgi:hypothetical protein
VNTVGEKWAGGRLFFGVESSDAETENTVPDFGPLRRLASTTGGRFFGPAELDRAPAAVAGKIPRPRERVRRVRRSLWDRLALLAAAALGVAGAWLVLRDTGGEASAE